MYTGLGLKSSWLPPRFLSSSMLSVSTSSAIPHPSISTCSLSFIFSLPPLFPSLSLRSSPPYPPSSPTLPPPPLILLLPPFQYHSCSVSFPLLHHLPSLSPSLPPLHPPFLFAVKGGVTERQRADSWEPLAVIGCCRLSVPVWSVSSSLSKYADVEMKT